MGKSMSVLLLLFTLGAAFSLPVITRAQSQSDSTRHSWNQWIKGEKDQNLNQDREVKDPGVALNKSLLYTFAPSAAGILIMETSDTGWIDTAGGILLAYGLLYGPARGNYYAEDYIRGTIGVGIRVVSAGVLLVASYTALTHTVDDIFDHNQKPDHNYTVNNITVAASILTFTGSIIYNIATAPTSAREYNDHYGLDLSFNIEKLNKTNRSAPVITAQINF